MNIVVIICVGSVVFLSVLNLALIGKIKKVLKDHKEAIEKLYVKLEMGE